MDNQNLIKKVIEFAESGNERRLLNTLHKRDNVWNSFELGEVLRAYCEIGSTFYGFKFNPDRCQGRK